MRAEETTPMTEEEVITTTVTVITATADLSGITNDSRRRFTENVRGAGKYRGWSEEGIMLYNSIVGKLLQQREDPALQDFEEKVRDLFQTEGKKRKGGPNAGGKKVVRAVNALKKRKWGAASRDEQITVAQQEAV